MELLDVEKFIALRGVLGCPLVDIPANLISQIDSSKNIVIVAHEDNLIVPDSLIYNLPEVKIYKLSELKNYRDYDARLIFEKWRLLALNNSKLHSGKIAQCVSLLMRHPDGLTRKDIKMGVPNCDKTIHKWMIQLKKEKIMTTEVKNGTELLHYDFSLIENGKMAEDIIKAKGRTNDKNIESPNNDSSIEKCNIEKQNNEKRAINKPTELNEELINKSIEAIKEHENGMPIKSLRTLLKLSPDILENLIEVFQDKPEFQVFKKSNRPVRIQYLGKTDTNYMENDVVNFLIDMCRAARLFVLSEIPKDIKKMKTSMQIEDDKFLDILEDNDFSIIEIRSKYINSEFIIFSDSVSESDPELAGTIEKVKAKVVKYFKTKVKFTFLKNIYLNAFDNNYLPYLKERVYHFYKFVIQEMKNNNNYFYFNMNCLLNMNFIAFVKCVPLRLDFQFVRIVSEIAKKNRKIKNSIDLAAVENMENITGEMFEKLNNSCLEAVQPFTLGEVLSMLKKDSEVYTGLLLRVNIHEFDRILQSFLKYNIFEGYIDEGNYLYFEQIEGIEKYIEKLLFDIKDEATEGFTYNISYSDRKRLYDMINDFSQEEFYSKTQELIEMKFEGEARDFFLKKLQTFK